MRIVYLALADARGHLMRAHVLRGVMARHGVTVDIVTTADDGARFLEALGTPSSVLPGGFGMELGDRHDFDAARTRRRVLRYGASLRDDVRALVDHARGADLVVNDSFHPALLGAHLWARDLAVVHVHGENLLAMVRAQARPLRIDRWLAHAPRIVHALDAVDATRAARAEVRLPPVTALPTRAPAEVRAALGVGSGARLCAVYLNPHYRAPEIAAFVEDAVLRAGMTLVGVSEPFAHRPGWRAADPAFVDVVAAADVFVSGAGMGALEQARVARTPLVCLLGAQHEQTQNARDRDLPVVDVNERDPAVLARALGQARRTDFVDARTEIARVQSLWAQALLSLMNRAVEEKRNRERPHHRARDRDQQPRRGYGPGGRQDRRLARALARAPAQPDRDAR